MIVYRLSKERYAKDLSGRGAERFGGRWNSKGIPMLYLSTSIALCTVEIAVHTPLGILPHDFQLTHIKLPPKAVVDLDVKLLPKDWKSFPHSDSTQQIGDKFIRNSKSLAIKVPSAVVQNEFNVLVNPLHPDVKKIKIVSVEDFGFDERLFLKEKSK